jgi:hypothetical protein
MITLKMLKKATAKWIGLEPFDTVEGPKEITLRFKFSAKVAGAQQLALATKKLALSQVTGVFVGQQFIYDSDMQKVRLVGILKVQKNMDEKILIPLLSSSAMDDYPVGTKIEVSVSTKGRSKRVTSEKAKRESK